MPSSPKAACPTTSQMILRPAFVEAVVGLSSGMSASLEAVEGSHTFFTGDCIALASVPPGARDTVPFGIVLALASVALALYGLSKIGPKAD